MTVYYQYACTNHPITSPLYVVVSLSILYLRSSAPWFAKEAGRPLNDMHNTAMSSKEYKYSEIEHRGNMNLMD